MIARPTAAAAVTKDDQLMLARDGSARLEPVKGATSISIGKAFTGAAVDEEFDAFIAEDCRQYLSAQDNARLDRAIDERRHAH